MTLVNGRPPLLHGTAATGRITALHVGQGHGVIRLADHRDIYFHRSDLAEGTPFNGFQIGDLVSFELLEDRCSGARALRVRRQPARGAEAAPARRSVARRRSGV